MQCRARSVRNATGRGQVLSAIIALEIGQVERFASAQNLASYAGLVPAARESAGKKRKGKCPTGCNWSSRDRFDEASSSSGDCPEERKNSLKGALAQPGDMAL